MVVMAKNFSCHFSQLFYLSTIFRELFIREIIEKILVYIFLVFFSTKCFFFLPSFLVQSAIKTSRGVVGDMMAVNVVECLQSIASLYGEHIILIQYIPSILDMVSIINRSSVSCSCTFNV